MARMKPADSWGVNVEHLTPALYTQILRVIAGKESPAKGQETTNDFWNLLPYFVLAGLGGCETATYSIQARRSGFAMGRHSLEQKPYFHSP